MKLYLAGIPYGTAVVAANSKEECIEMLNSCGVFPYNYTKEEKLECLREIEMPETPEIITLYQE